MVILPQSSKNYRKYGSGNLHKEKSHTGKSTAPQPHIECYSVQTLPPFTEVPERQLDEGKRRGPFRTKWASSRPIPSCTHESRSDAKETVKWDSYPSFNEDEENYLREKLRDGED